MTNYLVKQPPIARLLRGTVSLLAAVGWFHASNHCAIGEMLPKPSLSSEHASCHEPEAPAKSDEGGDCADLSCCKSLSAPAFSFAKSLVGDGLNFAIEQDYLARISFSSLTAHPAPIAELDTGPPGADSFAEAVLQRSLLAHAPPLA